MACNLLPYDQTIVNVNISTLTSLPVLQGFGIILFMTDEAGLGTGTPPDATNRTKFYANIDDLALDYAVTDEAYLAGVTLFAQNPSPIGFKVGFIAGGETLDTAIIAIEDYDCGFYAVTFTADKRDTNIGEITALGSWCSASDRVLGVTTNDANTENAATTGHVAQVLQASNISNVMVHYHTNPLLYPEIASLANSLSNDFNNSNSYYTAKHKSYNGISTIDKNSGRVRAITGFVPAIGLDITQGFFANTYVNVGGVKMNIEGQMSNGEFFDVVHLRHWLINRIQVAILTEQKLAKYIPMTDQGIAQLGSAVKRQLDAAVRMGGIASLGTDENGDVMPPYTIKLPRRSNIPAALANQRIVPNIEFTATLAGAIHYVTVTGVISV